MARYFSKSALIESLPHLAKDLAEALAADDTRKLKKIYRELIDS